MPSSRRAGSARSPGKGRLRLNLRGATDPELPSRSTLRRWVAQALSCAGEITLVFVDSRAGRRLNRQFRGRDYATNVLTFPYQIEPFVVADVVICLSVVRREALEQGKTLRRHLAHLIVHGVLHAQGLDHARAGDARRMEALERRLLAQMRIPDPYRGL